MSFLHAVWESWLIVNTASRRKTGKEPHFREDHNGYCAVLTPDELRDWSEALRQARAGSGKIFRFPSGLPDDGYRFEAVDFALPP